MRIILAILIALSLALAPISSSWAAVQMLASMDSVAPTDDAMSDCMKAMAAQKPAKGQHCPCCDTPAKAPCLDGGVCLAKCSVHVIAVLVPAGEFCVPVIRHNWPADPLKPPDWALSPPAPPPRA